ncbi:ATP-binding protein, partial [Oceanispirochaeta sp.]|uniref:ATP-binding protein n=1 Tax=Oceanispirochaeta sp. TaxID=2035350 RepID=UPI002636AB37
MLAILPVIILVYGLSSLFTLVQSSQAMEDQALEQAQLLSKSSSDNLESRIIQYQNISEDLSSAVITSINIETSLKAYRKRYPQFPHIFYTASNGLVRDMAPFEKTYMGIDLSRMEAWQKAFTEKVPVLSSPGSYFGSQSIILFAPARLSYVVHKEPSVEGVVALVLPLRILFKEISTVQIGSSGSIFVIDHKGLLLHHKDKNLILSGYVDDFSSLDSFGDVAQAMVDQKTGFASYGDRARRQYIAFSPIPSEAWSLGVQGSYGDITSEIRNITYTNILILLAGLILGAIIMYFMVHTVVKPIEDLTVMARKIAEGDRTIRSDLKTKSEVGDLSHSINLMVSELRAHHSNLEKILDDRTMELKRTNDEQGETIEELNTANGSLMEIRENLEQRVGERTQELQKAHNYIDNIINSMPSILIGVNPEGIITQWNKEAENKTGFTGNKVIGQSLDLVLPQFSDEMETIRDSISKRQKQHHTNSVRYDNGKILYNDLTVYPLIANGIHGAVVRIDDVTERVLMEESLRQSQKMDVLGQLAGGIAHDFNNMRGGILGGAELLQSMVKEDPKAKEFLSLIINSAKRAAELTGKLLIFSHKGRNVFTVIDLHKAIEGAVALLDRSLDKSIKIHTALNAELSNVKGDFTQLQNTFMNLGINAAHAMPDGGELIIISKITELNTEYCHTSPFDIAPGMYLEIEFLDNGEGIAPEILDHIFEPFFTTKRSGTGTGLGLSAVYSAIQQHQGAISVTSELNHGTSFKLYLPLIEDQPESRSQDSSMTPGKGCILIVDDESVIRMV